MELEIQIVEILNEDGWNLLPDKKKGLHVTTFEGENGVYEIYLNLMNLYKNLIVTYGYIPIKAAENKITNTALLLNKINRQLYFGNFELDYSNGEIAFRNGIHFIGENFSKYMAVNTISPCAFTVDKYYPAIKSILEQDLSPEEALKLVK